MFKYFISATLCMAIFKASHAQQKTSLLFDFVATKKQLIQPLDITQLFSPAVALPPGAEAALISRQALQLNKAVARTIWKSQPSLISLVIPAGNNKTYRLQLAAQDISSDGLAVSTVDETGKPHPSGMVNAAHYRGYVDGYPASIAALSVFENGEAMLLFSNEEGNFNAGKVGNSDKYVLYNSRELKAALGFECHAAGQPVTGNDKIKTVDVPQPSAAPALLCKKLRWLWEADYKLFSNNFSSNLTNTANYIAGLFNQVAAMYQNEGVLIELNDTYIWTSPDPYITSTAANGLATLKNRYNGLSDNFNADLCMLLDGAPTNNGGLAYILDNDLCNRAYAYGYANVYAAYNTIPTYSWDVEVMTHEMGHLLGSYHTQWCGWNTGAGNTCGAIDDCYAVEASPACTTCNATTNTNPSAPAGFMGTVMSYCYLRAGIGVNLSNGFGLLPQAKIRANISGAACPVLNNQWTGAVSSAWENAANWSCGSVPDINTDVSISAPSPNYPVVNSSATCRRIKQQPGTTVTVRTGFALKVAGAPHR